MSEKILVIGASGQIGIELVLELRNIHGNSNVIASDIKTPPYEIMEGGPYELLDVLNKNQISVVVKKHDVTQIYLLAALLSATAEQHPEAGWQLNVNGLLNVLDTCNKLKVSKLFWPSTIAVFGPTTPKTKTPQKTIMEPNTIYGISKLAGERWCEYYHVKYGIDVRSIRYPGIVGYKSSPGGGTTDYAVHIYHEAIKHGKYTCFLNEDTTLPMMYMPDAIKATIQLMEAKSNTISIRSSYNVAGMSFSPKDVEVAILKHLPDFMCSYKPDLRQQYAKGWPQTIDDSSARNDWSWRPKYNLETMTLDMLKNLGIGKNLWSGKSS